MDRLKVGLLFGGPSEEHPVAVKSARQVLAHLDPDRYDVTLVGITPDGQWRLVEGPEAGWEDGPARAAVLSPDRSVHGLLVLGPGPVETVRLDVVLPVLHGRYGEDGAIQGLLELAGIPYVGCGISASALAMDKSLTYVVAGAAGVRTPSYRVVGAGERLDPAALTYPVFVKPARSGSSFGVSKVTAPAELADALAAARRYDAKVVVEDAVDGTEVGCAVLGSGADLLLGEVDRIGLTHGFFRIHQEDAPEQGSDNATVTVPADISDRARERVRETALATYRALGCGGLARVDLFLLADDSVVLNEVNTFPGLTSYSRYPRMMQAAGLGMTALLDRLLAEAVAR